MSVRSFVDHSTRYASPLLTEEYRIAERPLGIKGELYIHQLRNLAAMQDLEATGTRQFDSVHFESRIDTGIGMLNEPAGSGKTVIILALISSGIPPNRPIHSVITINKQPTVVEKIFPSVIKASIVFASSSVILQWKTAIAKFTSLNAMVIENVRGVREFHALMKNNIVPYDIILVRVGVVSQAYDGITTDSMTNIVDIISHISIGKCWSRVVYDDSYDLKPIPQNMAILHASFTWMVSATVRPVNVHQRTERNNVPRRNTQFSGAAESMLREEYPTKPEFKATALWKVLAIRNTPELVEASVSIGAPIFWKHITAPRHRRAKNNIEALVGDASLIMNMLNADAIGQAAREAGIATDDINILFKKLLNDHYAEYSDIARKLAAIALFNIDELMALPVLEDYQYTARDVAALRLPTHRVDDIKAVIERGIASLVKRRTEISHALDRVKQNMDEGECPVCCSDIVDDDAIIMRCCSKLLCASCGVTAAGLRATAQNIVGRCPNCQSAISFNSLIFLSKDVDLNDMLVDGKFAPQETVDEKIEGTKFETIVSIIMDRPDNRVPLHAEKMNGVLYGTKILPPAPYKKVIIYASFDESLEQLHEQLTTAGIKNKVLRGSCKEISCAALDFESDSDMNVLLINGARYAAGLNLQSASDLIFANKVEHEAQMIGRVQRLGQKYRVNIHYLEDRRL